MKRRAFTLIELMVVIAIIGIVAAMVVPAVTQAVKKRPDSTPGLAPAKNAGRSVLAKPTKLVTDTTGSIPAQLLAALNDKLARLEHDTTAQVLVYMVSALPDGEDLESLCNTTFNAWGVGRADRKNGLVLFIFKDSRKLRVETGYGLEGRIPDAVSKRLTSEKVTPRFKAGDYAGGVTAAVDELDRLVRAEAASANWAAAGGKEAAATASPLTKSQPSPAAGAGSGLSSSSSSSVSTVSSSNSPSPAPFSAQKAQAPVQVPQAAGRAVVVPQEAVAAQTSGDGWLVGFLLLIGAFAICSGAAWYSGRSKIVDLARERNASREENKQLRSRLSSQVSAASQFEARADRAEAKLAKLMAGAWLLAPDETGWWWHKSSVGAAPQPHFVGTLSSVVPGGFWSKTNVPTSEPEVRQPEVRRRSATPAAAAVGLVAAAAAAATVAASPRRREKIDPPRSDPPRPRRRDDDDDSRRSSYSSPSFDSGSSSSSSDSGSFDSGGGSSGGGGSSDSW